MLEKVQRRFTRMFSHLKKLPYEELGLWSFEESRNRADIIEVFKMVKQLSSIPCNQFFKRAEDSVTRGHSWKLVKDCCRCDCRLHFLSQRMINRWNSLSQDDMLTGMLTGRDQTRRLDGLQGQQTQLSIKRPIDCLLSLERLFLKEFNDEAVTD